MLLISRKSFESVQTWLSDARRLASSKLCIILCGNKSDLTETRKIDREEASQFAAENRLIYCETSALTGDGVEHVFTECAQRILAQIESGKFVLFWIISILFFVRSQVKLIRRVMTRVYNMEHP